MNRNIKYIAVHCTATQPTATVSAIQNYWKNEKGWKMPGYHFIITADGQIVNLLPITEVSNGVKGFNSVTINVCYIGGIDAKGKPKDTRTEAQKASLLKVLKDLRKQFPKAIIQGHRDFPKVAKACPSFDAKKEYENI
ncbi:N-acetylmuramoyl-L-alanine amidase [Chryseobacterium daeguense]|uniref:N-acetylmuramoyl-L-alanine amidase n=1 Tax=Chryseobacterium daeguense TaxID=412438 RepID=UPI00054F4E67|nr:N-acetylmuramoyl-L-alanine amidase [Chryseobacterium daeguense]